MKLIFLILITSFFSCASKLPVQEQKDFAFNSKNTPENLHTFFHSKFHQIKDEKLKTTKIKTEHFIPYQTWLNDIKAVTQEEDLSKKLSYCLNEIVGKPFKYPYKFLYNNLVIKCNHLAYQEVDKANTQNADSYLGIFLKRIHVFVEQPKRKILSFLKKVKNKESLDRLNYQITQFYIKEKKTPPKYLMNYVSVTSDFSKLISSFGYDSESSQKRKFQYIMRDIRKLYRKGGEPQIKNLVRRYFNRISRNIKKHHAILSKPQYTKNFIDFSLFLIRNNYFNKSREILSHLQKNYKFDKKQKNRLYFAYIWSFINEGSFEKAISYIINEKLIAEYPNLYSQTQFWITYVVEHSNNKPLALNLKKMLVKHNPISYYASIVMSDLEQSDKEAYKELSGLYKAEEEFDENEEKMAQYESAFLRIKDFKESGAASLITLEIKEIQDHFLRHNKSREDINYFYYTVTQKLHEYEAYLISFRILFQAMEEYEVKLSYKILKSIFPKPFEREIGNKKDSLNETLLYSLIRQESGFNPQAKSPVGATGLMQLMFNTARRYKGDLKKVSLQEPDVNLEIGVKYLKDLFKRYGDNLVDILSAYNAGESRIDKWRKTYLKNDSRLINIESIPFNETRKYVKLILRNIYFYNFINGKSNPFQINRSLSSKENES